MTEHVDRKGFEIGSIVKLVHGDNSKHELIINGFSLSSFDEMGELGRTDFTLANCICCHADGNITNVDINVELFEDDDADEDVEITEGFEPEPDPGF